MIKINKGELTLEKEIIIIGLYIFLIISALVFLFPLIYMIFKSFFSNNSFSFHNYIDIFKMKDLPFIKWIFNTVITGFLIVFSNLLFVSVLAYYFVFIFKKVGRIIAFFILIISFFPIQIFVIPHFLIVNKFFPSAFLKLISPYLVTPFSFYIFYRYFKTIDSAIIDFARSDGCNNFQIFYYILFPLSRPIFAVVSIILFINWWNYLLWPLIILQKQDFYTINIGIVKMKEFFLFSSNTIYAVATISVIPILCLFFIFKRFFIESLTLNQLRNFY